MGDTKSFFTDKIKILIKQKQNQNNTYRKKQLLFWEGQQENVSEKVISEDQVVAEVFKKFSPMLFQT